MTLTAHQLRVLTAILSRFNSPKHAITALGHLYFAPGGVLRPNDAGRNTVMITASDLELHLCWPLTLQDDNINHLHQPCSCPIAWFLKVARPLLNVKNGRLELRPNGPRLSAYPSKGPSCNSPEPSLPPDELPAFDTVPYTISPGCSGWLSQAAVRAAHSLIPFISDDPTRFVLNGAHIEPNGLAVATDGRRLAVIPPSSSVGPQLSQNSAAPPTNNKKPITNNQVPVSPTHLPTSVILPPRLIKALHHALAELQPTNTPETAIPLWFKSLGKPSSDPESPLPAPDPSRLLLALPNSGPFLISSLIDGNFPAWRNVLPSAQHMKAVMTLAPGFAETLRQLIATSTCPAKDTSITFDLVPGGPVLARLVGNARGSDPVLIADWFTAGTHLSTTPFKITANLTFLQHCLEVSGTTFRLIDDKSPLLSGDPGHPQSVLMPLRTIDKVQ